MNLHIWRVLTIAVTPSLSDIVCAAAAFKQVVLALVPEQIAKLYQ